MGMTIDLTNAKPILLGSVENPQVPIITADNIYLRGSSKLNEDMSEKIGRIVLDDYDDFDDETNTKIVENTDVLDGHPAEYYASAESVVELNAKIDELKVNL